MISYLLASSAPFDYVAPHEGITAAADAERGKKVFQVRGCLACHQHADFPEAASTHGPNLSRIGAKVASHPRGKEWLYSWLREPARYHPRTIMPNVLLEPVKHADGSVSDPAADAVAYLAGSTEGWTPEAIPSAGTLTDDERAATQELALLYLKERFPDVRARAVLRDGLGPDMAAIQGDERMLAGLDPVNRDARLLEYVGKKTIAKLACAGCHDIPGFEDTKPAGAALADWGRKESSKIAFEQVSQFVMHQLSHGGGHHGHGGGHTDHAVGAEGDGHASEPVRDELASDLAFEAPEEAHVSPESLDRDTGFFLEKLLAHEREGFLWQKLRAPRSYDYKKAENKTYNERYRIVRAQACAAGAGPARRPRGGRAVQLRRLPHAADGPLGPPLQARDARRGARVRRLSVPVAALHARPGRGLARQRPAGAASRHARGHAGARRGHGQAAGGR